MCRSQEELFVWISFHKHREIYSGSQTIPNSSDSFLMKKMKSIDFIDSLVRMRETEIDRYDSRRRILALSLFISKHHNAVMNKQPNEFSKASRLIMHIVEKISAVLIEHNKSVYDRQMNGHKLSIQWQGKVLATRLVYRNPQFRTSNDSFKIFSHVRLTHYHMFPHLSCEQAYLCWSPNHLHTVHEIYRAIHLVSVISSAMSSIQELHFMKSLQTAEQIQLLDLIDSLRAEGLSEFTALSQLIVCGDQSSGKSSLLEAISGISFPRKDNLCTRFATEVILRRTSDSEITVSLICLRPHQKTIFLTFVVLYRCQERVDRRSIKIVFGCFETKYLSTMTLWRSLSRLKMPWIFCLLMKTLSSKIFYESKSQNRNSHS